MKSQHKHDQASMNVYKLSGFSITRSDKWEITRIKWYRYRRNLSRSQIYVDNIYDFCLISTWNVYL